MIQTSLSNKPARLWTILSLLWIFPSAGALWLLLVEGDWSSGNISSLQSFPLELWLAVVLLLLHVMFIGFAIYHARRRG